MNYITSVTKEAVRVCDDDVPAPVECEADRADTHFETSGEDFSTLHEYDWPWRELVKQNEKDEHDDFDDFHGARVLADGAEGDGNHNVRYNCTEEADSQ